MKCRSGIAAIGVAIIGVLVGCGASPVQSSSAPLRPTPTVTKTPTLSYKGTRLTVVPKSWAQTCIPRTDRYVTLTVASSHPTVTVYVGHPLTAQGVAWDFLRTPGRLQPVQGGRPSPCQPTWRLPCSPTVSYWEILWTIMGISGCFFGSLATRRQFCAEAAWLRWPWDHGILGQSA